ncbi:MAG: hypothetical protein ABI896_10120 [Actinomycetota bacterium]
MIDIRRRNGIETTIGLRGPANSLDLRNRGENHQSEGSPSDRPGAMNRID